MNIVYRSYTIPFIAVSIKNIVDMSGNKQFVKTRACMSFITRNRCTPTYTLSSVSATPPPPLLYPASAVAPYRTKAGQFPPFLRKIFNDDPQFLHFFGRAPGGL